MITEYIAELNLSDGAIKLLEFVFSFPPQRPVQITELAKNLKMSRQSVYTYFEELEKKGVLEGNGKESSQPTKK